MECKGPYHIRKRCPKLIALADEKEKSRRMTIPEQQVLMNNQYQFYPNNPQYSFQPPYYYYHHHPNNGYAYPFPMVSHQRVWTQPYSNEQPIIYPNFPYHETQMTNSNRSFYSNNQRRKQCYGCGSPNHLRAQCPQFQANPIQR